MAILGFAAIGLSFEKKEVRFAKGLVAYTQPYHIILRPQCVAVGQRIEKILCVCSTTFRLMTETLNE